MTSDFHIAHIGVASSDLNCFKVKRFDFPKQSKQQQCSPNDQGDATCLHSEFIIHAPSELRFAQHIMDADHNSLRDNLYIMLTFYAHLAQMEMVRSSHISTVHTLHRLQGVQKNW